MSKSVLLILWFSVGSLALDKNLKDSIHHFLPPTYGVDNIIDCHKGGNFFCETKIQFRPQQNDTIIWKYITELKEDKHKFRKDKIYRGICVPREFEDKEEYVRQRFNHEMANVSLEVDSIKIYNCLGAEYKLTTFQQALLNAIFLYATFILFATFYDYKIRKRTGVEPNRYLIAFSMLHNNDKLQKPITNPHYEKLKSMQGIRTYNTMLVVLGHSLLNYFIMYVANTDFIEYMTTARIKLFFTWGLFLVQPFFMITGWLTMVFFHQFSEKNKKITVVHMLGVVFFRVIRLYPLLIFSILMHYSGIMKHIYKGGTVFFMDNDHKCCQERWWSALTFMSSLYPISEMCNLATWYLSSDFQIFTATLVAMFVILKYKLPVIRSLVALLFVTLALQSALMYVKNLDVAFRVLPETFLIYNVIDNYDEQLHLWYISALSNAPSFIIGMIFGSIFYQKGEQKYFNSQTRKILWFLCFFGVPFSAIYLSTNHYNRLTSALLGAMTKPMYALGIAIGILGMTEGVGGVIRKICEWGVAVMLAPITYGVYLLHIANVFHKTLTVIKLEPIVVSTMITTSILNIVISFTLGYLASLAVDMPWNNVKNILTNRDTSVKSKKNKTH